MSPALGLRNAGVLYAYLLLAGVLVAVSAAKGNPPYLADENVGNLLEQTSLTAILAIGMTVLLISGNFDLSVGSLAALTATVTAILSNSIGPWGAICAGVAVGVLGGCINGLVHWMTGLNSFIVTLGTLTAYRGATLLLSDSESVNVNAEARETLRSIGGDYVRLPNLIVVLGIALLLGGLYFARSSRITASAFVGTALAAGALSTRWSYPLRLSDSTVVMFAVLLVTGFVLRWTVTGRRLYAVGGSQEAARAAGVVLSRYRIVPFVVVGLCAGISGVLWTARLATVDPNIFSGMELQVLASAIVGGVALTGGAGTATKTFVGALLLFTMSNGFNLLNVPPALQQLFTGVLVILAAAAYVLADRRARTRA